MFLTEPQLDAIIEDASKDLGWTDDDLAKIGHSRSKRQAVRDPNFNDYRWTSPISYYFDSNIRKEC
jgi:hypothetical protein